MGRLEPLLPQRERRFRYPGAQGIAGPGGAVRDLVRATHRNPVGVPAAGVGVRLGHDVLAQVAGLERGRRLTGAGPGPAGRAECGLAAGLVPLRGRLLSRQGVKRGQHTGPLPIDRGRPGSKHHLITDRHGTPLAVLLTGGNRIDVTQLLPCSTRSHRSAAGLAVPAASLTRSSRTAATTTTSTATRSAPEASCRPSPAAAPGTAPDWALTAGWSQMIHPVTLAPRAPAPPRTMPWPAVRAGRADGGLHPVAALTTAQG